MGQEGSAPEAFGLAGLGAWNLPSETSLCATTFPPHNAHGDMTQSLSSQNHYKILSLPTPSDAGQALTLTIIKSAYHRALLVHHPDKSPPSTSPKPKYTIDQITQAYRILSDPASRSSFDKELRLHSHYFAPTRDCSVAGLTPDSVSETIDLDELAYEEEQNLWYKGCRCGQERGFIVTEDHLESRACDGEVLVGCTGCSLWIRVLFAVENGG